MHQLMAFIRESNAIEGILREPFGDEVAAAENFLAAPTIFVATLCELQSIFAPNMPLREVPGENVRVGSYVAPPGGPEIRTRLENILHNAHTKGSPWRAHCLFEMLHPFMDGNGRAGRMLWVWHMRRIGLDPFIRPFLHSWYYQTLENSRR
jgi:Fic/DOC family